MIGNMLELRNHFEGLMIERVKTTLRRMIDGGTNESTFGDETGV